MLRHASTLDDAGQDSAESLWRPQCGQAFGCGAGSAVQDTELGEPLSVCASVALRMPQRCAKKDFGSDNGTSHVSY